MKTQLLSLQAENLVNKWLDSIPRSDGNLIENYYQMVKNHPVVSAAADLRILLGMSMLREYQNFDELLQQEVRSAIANSKGSWLFSVAEMMTYLLYGYSYTEIAYQITKKEITTFDLLTLDARKYRFEGIIQSPSKVVYGGTTKEIKIDYHTGIHLINQQHLIPGRDPYGIALCRRAYKYWDLYNLIMVALAVAGQRQATPMLVGKTDTAGETALLKSDGLPLINEFTGQPILINRGYSLQKRLQEVENSSVLVVDRLDEIIAIAQHTTGEFLLNILHYLESMMLLSFLVPQTVTGTSNTGTGDSNLNEGHRETLRLVTRSSMAIVADTLIEKLFKPMLQFNHGDLDDYGSFPLPEEESENTIELMDAIGRAVSDGRFSPKDMDVINRSRKLAGMPLI